MASSQAAKCVAVDVDDQMDDDLLFYIYLHFLDKKCQDFWQENAVRMFNDCWQSFDAC